MAQPGASGATPLTTPAAAAPAPGTTPAPAPTPSPAPVVPEPGAWREALPEAVRSWEEVGQAQSADQFWDGMTNMRGRMGQSVRVPSNEAGPQDWVEFQNKLSTLAPGRFNVIPNRDSPEEMAAFHKTLGVPDKPDGYLDIESTADAPVNAQQVGAFKNIAHKHGLTPEQFRGVVVDFNAVTAAQNVEAMKPINEEREVLKGEWGAAYDQRNGTVVNLMQKFGFPEPAIEAFKAGNADAKSIRALYAMAEAIGGEGGGLINTDAQGGAPLHTPQEAEARIREIMNSPDYSSNDVVVRKAAVERMVELQRFVTASANDLHFG